MEKDVEQNNNVENHQKGFRLKQIIVSIVVLCWIFGSIGAMIYFAKHENTPLAIGILGQFFFVLGILAIYAGIKDKQFQPITLVFPAAGICMMVGAYIYATGGEDVGAKMEEMLPYMFLILFVLIGIGIVVLTTMKRMRRHKVCTTSVYGKCVEVHCKWHRGGASYSPEYEVYFNGKTFTLCNELYTGMNRIEIGESREIFLNPNDPKEFYEPIQEKITNRIIYLIGICFTLFPAFALFMMTRG